MRITLSTDAPKAAAVDLLAIGVRSKKFDKDEELTSLDKLLEQFMPSTVTVHDSLTFTDVDGMIFTIIELATRDEDATIREDEDGTPVLESGIGEHISSELFAFFRKSELDFTVLSNIITPLLDNIKRLDLNDVGGLERTSVQTMSDALENLHCEIVGGKNTLRNS